MPTTLLELIGIIYIHIGIIHDVTFKILGGFQIQNLVIFKYLLFNYFYIVWYICLYFAFKFGDHFISFFVNLQILRYSVLEYLKTVM